MWHLGVDEAGRGPVIGPLVVAAFACPESDISDLADKGVRDSKRIPSSEREELARWLVTEGEVRGWRRHVHICLPRHLDNAIRISNLNELENRLFALCIDGVSRVADSGILMLDACDVNVQRFAERTTARVSDWPWEGWAVDSRHGADDHHPAVAAASILAKQAREDEIVRIQSHHTFDIGSGYPSDERSRNALKRLIEIDELEDVRWSWQTFRDIWSECRNGAPPLRPMADDDPLPPAQRTLF